MVITAFVTVTKPIEAVSYSKVTTSTQCGPTPSAELEKATGATSPEASELTLLNIVGLPMQLPDVLAHTSARPALEGSNPVPET